jgi:hypothetical protein
MMYLMNAADRIESFARRKCPRAILTNLLNEEYYTIEELRCVSNREKPFCVRTVRYWARMLNAHGYLQSGVNMQKDMRVKRYRLAKDMVEPVNDLLRRVPEDECQRLQ